MKFDPFYNKLASIPMHEMDCISFAFNYDASIWEREGVLVENLSARVYDRLQDNELRQAVRQIVTMNFAEELSLPLYRRLTQP